MTPEHHVILTTTAILCLTIITVIALGLGFDGAILLANSAVIAGLAGYEINKAHTK